MNITYTIRNSLYVNLTNHCYFNLAGAGTILSHDMVIDADSFTETEGAANTASGPSSRARAGWRPMASMALR